MFEQPDAKRVKRSKIFSSFSSSEDETNDTIETPSHISNFKNSTLKSGSNDNKKPVRRSSKKEYPDDDPNDAMQVDYGFDYEFIDVSQPSTSAQKSALPTKSTEPLSEVSKDVADRDTDPKEPAEETYAFNLFAPKSKPKPTKSDPTTTTEDTDIDPPTHPVINTITIRSPTPESALNSTSSGGRILKPRPQHHYFTSALPAQTLTDLRAQYASSAISGTTLLSLTTTAPWPGTHLPWRVISIPKHRLSVPVNILSVGTQSATTTMIKQYVPETHSRVRPRPSKKRRIQVRQRIAAREAVKVTAQKAEEAEREKRTRRNREKKVKRKLREKAKKAEGQVDPVSEGEGRSEE